MDIATVPGTGTLIGPNGHRGDDGKDAVFALSRETALLDAHLSARTTDSEVRNRGAIEHTSRETERMVHVGFASAARDSAHGHELALAAERRIEERVRLEGERTRDLIQTLERERLARALNVADQTLLVVNALKIAGVAAATGVPTPPVV